MFQFTRLARSLAVCAAMAMAFLLSAPVAHAAMYVDNKLGDVTDAQKVKIADPQPVQVVFQFTTKEKANKAATKFTREKVLEAVRNSGLFTEVSEAPVASGAVLKVTVDNIPQEGAASKGFVTGLTFGLKSAAVTDYYVCTVEYQPAGGSPAITKTANHAIHTTIGLASVAVEGTKAPSIKEAVYTMTRQIVSNAVNSLGSDPAFPGSPTAAQAEPVLTPTAEPALAEAPAAEPAATETPVT